MSNYDIKKNDNFIELWSTKRLPCEPKEWLVDMRVSLRAALENVNDSPYLHAVYISKDEKSFDVENALFYNVGVGPFSHLCNKGLLFERKYSEIPKHNSMMEHYYCYSNEKVNSNYWEKERCIAVWSEISCPPPKGDIKPHHVWSKMKDFSILDGKIKVNKEHNPTSYYGIKIIIKAPKGGKFNLAAFTKPLLDGIISAFHVHDGYEINKVTNRLKEKIQFTQSDLKKMLLDTKIEVLGERKKLVYPYYNTVKWNPMDDKFVIAEILIEDSMNESWLHSGEIYTVHK